MSGESIDRRNASIVSAPDRGLSYDERDEFMKSESFRVRRGFGPLVGILAALSVVAVAPAMAQSTQDTK